VPTPKREGNDADSRNHDSQGSDQQDRRGEAVAMAESMRSATRSASVSGIVRPAPSANVLRAREKLVRDRGIIARPQEWAPAWFYSALNWLGKTYYDANHATQNFSNYMAGSDVDPYQDIGSTRLFLIVRVRDTFRLSIAPDTESLAPLSGGATYPNTDAGIREMYLALADSPVFARVTYCYVPTRIGLDLDPKRGEGLESGYDPATGLRAVVLGTAVSQVVPLDDFIKTRNEQIYNPNPTIVPLVTALVYDVTRHNTLGAKTFALPALYTRDRLSAGTDYVTKLGQTVAFAGGPGYNDTAATALTLETLAEVAAGGAVFRTYTFDTATVVTTSTVGFRVETGIAELTYASPSPASVFAKQQFLGFYRDDTWTTCLGLPIWDYGTDNARFTAATAAPVVPITVYDPTHAFLSGGSLQNVVRKLRDASYLFSWDSLIALLDLASHAPPERGVGLVTTAAALDFNLSSAAAGAPIVDQLEVPVVVTVTTTPPVATPPVRRGIRERVAGAAAVGDIAENARAIDQVIGSGANTPRTTTPGPTTIQAGLNASIPREALEGTGIISLEIGTAFPDQPLGDGATLQASPDGTVVNLIERHGTDPALAPYDVPLAKLGVALRQGISYVFALTGKTLSVRGSDGSTATTTISKARDAVHTFVGAIVYGAAATRVRLYPKLQLSLPAPAVGTHGVLQGEQYSVRLTYAAKNSMYDLLDAMQAPVAERVSVPSPEPTDKSQPRAGDVYLGSFVGGATTMTVWSLPVFLTVTPQSLPGASFNGTMTLNAQISGVPAYRLQVTDSSLFVFSNINVDSRAVGSVSDSNVFLASAVINSAPDDTSSKAFAPSKVIMGLVRPALIGSTLKYVFAPAEDSIVIGTTRYMLSIIELEALDFDPNARPYPPAAWPRSQFWQFANKHDPYLEVQYTGPTQDDRIDQAQDDTERIGDDVRRRGEPMHLYLDTDRKVLTMWPIYGFPLDRLGRSVDTGRFRALTDEVLELLANAPEMVAATTNFGTLDAERIAVPGALVQVNPFETTAQQTTAVPNEFVAAETLVAKVAGRPVTNLSANVVAPAVVESLDRAQSARSQSAQRRAAGVAFAKNLAPGVAVTQDRPVIGVAVDTGTSRPSRRQTIYGYSVYNANTGEAYLVELVPYDQDIPDQLPRPTENLTYDPFYVRVVFLRTLTCYNMSIIVPAMVHDQYGHFARQGTPYDNLLSKTDELKLGYLYSLFDADNTFDALTFEHYPWPLDDALVSESAIFTNVPYSIGDAQPPASTSVNRLPTPYFACRRKNWSADCHLMQATHTTGMSYLAFGAGDLVPLRLDASFRVDKRAPAHLYKLTYTFSDRQYNDAKTISVANKPYVVAVTTTDAGVPQYMNFSINATAGTADLAVSENKPLKFPTEIYVAGQASTTLTSVIDLGLSLGTALLSTGDFLTLDEFGLPTAQEFQLIPYNNLVYLVRAVANCPPLGAVGGLGTVSGLLVDVYVPATTGNLALAQGARHKRSQMQFFGATYTPTTMVDTLDNLDFASITGETFFVPTIFIPIPELDATKGFVADISNFLGQQFWTLIYPEIVARAGESVNGVDWDHDVNVDVEGKPVLSLQKLHFVFDPLVTLFTPNDLAHKYALQPKQQVLALTNGQIQEGICWRSANVQEHRLPPHNISAQQILPEGEGMDRANIIYSSHNRPVETPIDADYLGMSVNNFVSVSATVYNIEESALANDQTGTSFISSVSSVTNMVLGVLFDYDNNDIGTLDPYDPSESTKGVVFLNGYLSAAGYTFSSPDHFDVNDVLPSQVPLLEQIADTMGFDVAYFNTDVSLPRQFWSMAYDTFTGAGLPGFIPNVPPSLVDPTFSNRTRSLLLSLQNPLHPEQIGMMDTYTSVVSANLHLKNGVTGSVFLSKKADRDVASIGTNPVGPNSFPLYGLPTKYDFFIFSRDHYWTLKGASFELIDQGYAMCLVDDGSGTGTKVAKYFIDADGNYYELFSYALYSPNGGILETSTFTMRVSLGAPGNLSASPIIPATPNNVNPQDLVAQINKVSNLIYAAFGPSSGGQPPAFLPIQAVTGPVQAAPIVGPPGFDGYLLNVVAANRQPVQISQIYSGTVAYAIAGSTTVAPVSAKTGRPLSFLGSISHGLDRMLPVAALQSADLSEFIPRTTVPPGPAAGLFGGNGLGALIATPFSCAFQGAGAVPPAIAANPNPGTTMRADDTVFYTFNAVTNGVMDSTGRSASASGGQYFVDDTDPANPIYGVVSLPKFTLNGNTYAINMSTTLIDGVTSRYSLVVGGRTYLFGPDNAHVTVDRTRFTFNPLVGGAYTVSYTSLDQPEGDQAPSPVALTPFSVAMGGLVATIDVFNDANALNNIVLGVIGRQYSYDPVHATVTIHAGAVNTPVPIATGTTFASPSAYGYVVGYRDGTYTINDRPMFPYAASTTGAPATHALMTAPQMFTLGSNFYTFDKDATGAYVSVTGNQQTYPINPYQFSINGRVYIINTNVQPNTVIGGGNVYAMTASNTQFVLNGVQYTVVLKQGSLSGATISGQFNIEQGNVVVVENYVYQIDTLNGQIVGNGTTYPLTTSGVTYTITTADRSFTVTTEPNATTVTIGNIVYQINNTTVVGDGVVYPILEYRTFVDGPDTFSIGFDGTVSIPTTFALSGSAPFTRSTFNDGSVFTVNDIAAFDGTTYFPMSGSPAEFSTAGRTYAIRTDAVSIAAGPSKTYLARTAGPVNPNEFTFGTATIFLGRPTDVAAFDGENYFAIANNEFTDTITGDRFTLSGNTAVHEGNSYVIFSNLGQGAYFEVPGEKLYYVNVPVADLGTANGDVFEVFPVSGGQFTIPLRYTITVAAGVVTVDAITFAGGPTVVATLTAVGGSLTGGFFVDPVTNITYTAVIDGSAVTFVDSSNTVYPFPAAGAPDTLVATVVVATGVTVAVDDQAVPVIYPVLNNQFVDGPATYAINVPIAYENIAGPHWPMINGRFIVPNADPISSIAYTVQGGSVTKGYVVSVDDQFSVDGDVVYTVNAVNVVKATNETTLTGASPVQTLTAGPLTYTLDETTSQARVQPAGLDFDSATEQFTATVSATTATDDRHPSNTFPVTAAGPQRTFTDSSGGVTFSFDSSGDNPITAAFVYTNFFFIDALTGVTYYIDQADSLVEAVSYLPETTQYAFTPDDGNTYLIHYNDVRVVFPVISGANVNAGIATVGANRFTVDIDHIDPVGGGGAIPINQNSFEINGNLFTIAGVPVGADYSACTVVGDNVPPRPFTSASTFTLTDPAVVYTVQLDAANLPASIAATFPIRPSRNLITVNDDVYIITYHTVSTGSLLGQGQAAIAINGSSFTLTNRFDTTKAKFIFANLNIFNAASVVGQFTAYLAPTFFIGGTTYTLDPVRLLVTDADKRPYPLIPNPTMFSINGFNYLIDSNHIPHRIVGNNNISPLSTDVTVESGEPIPHSTFTLNGLIYKYTEDAAHNLLTITGVKSYMIAQPALTFKLDSSLVFTLSTVPPAPGNFPGTVVPIGTVTAGTLVLNVYAGTPESGGADFFMYKNVLYTLVESGGVYVAVQKSYTVYVSQPEASQQQLAVFDLNGTTYMVTDGATTGVGAAEGINPGTMWAATSTSAVETQFGLVYGFTAQPTNVTRSATDLFQFQAADATGTTTLYDVMYTEGGNTNVVKVDIPALLPTFTQTGPFVFTPSYPLTFETGGYNAFTTFVAETSTPSLSFAGAYKTPVRATDPLVDTLITDQGDFTVEFWHSIPSAAPSAYHPFTYAASDTDPLVFFADVDFEDDSNIYVGVNNTVLHAVATPPVFSSGWRHFALTYQQPFTMLCQGGGFEVKKGNSYNFNRDFSIAMTFSVSDASLDQGLLYKGTGSDITTPQLSMSYRVGVSGGSVTLQFTDAGNVISPLFVGPAVTNDQFFQMIIVKHTTTPAGRDDSSDPYAPPFDTTDLGAAATGGMSGTASGFPEDGGTITISDVGPAGVGATTRSAEFLNSLASPPAKAYSVDISVRTVNDDGTFGTWQTVTTDHVVTNGDPGLAINPTGAAHLLIGAAFADDGTSLPLGRVGGDVGNIRQVYLFNGAIDRAGIRNSSGTVVDIANASSDDLLKAGLVGYWAAKYDPDGLIISPFDPAAIAISTNRTNAFLAPLSGHEREGVTLYVNGYPMTLTLVTGADIPSSMTGFGAADRQLTFNAGLYRLAEISMWRMIRQQYQVVDDMFGRLIPTNEPFLMVYLSGSFLVQAINAPILPMNKYIDNIDVTNPVASMPLAFARASLDLAGCPAVGRCGPLITPNLYTPPGVALTVCDSVPDLTTYSVTLNTLTAALAGVINEAYVYVKDNVLTLYAGKKVGDLVLSWVSQEQGDVQLIGYIEGAPPAPMANLTNKASYPGATSITFSAPTSVTLKLQKGYDSSDENKIDFSDSLGAQFGLNMQIAPFGFGMAAEKFIFSLFATFGLGGSYTWSNGDGSQITASNKLDESNKYTVKLQGTLAPVTGDLFMSSLNSVTTQSTTVGNAASKTAILPNPNLGGFTSSNPPAALPKAPTEEKFGARMYVPSPYGQAFVTSQTLDVYQQTLVQTNTVYGFVRIPNAQIPRDLNIVSFRINSQYLRPGVLDGVVGYVYNPATLPTGAQTYATSTGQMAPLYDKNFSPGTVGHDASYMRIVEAYKLKRQIDQQAFNALALYQTQYDTQAWPTDSRLTPGLDFYNEYLWTSRGGTQEVKHTYTTSYDEVYTTTSGNTAVANINFNIKLAAAAITVFDIKFAYTYTSKFSVKSSYNTTGTSSFDISASFDGIESDTQMRYASNNDAHFVMKFNSAFNQNNQSGLNLVIGSDGLVYNIAPSVSSGAGLPMSNNLDDSQTYTQPQPAYASGNANGITGALEPYDRPGKVKQFRTYAFFLQPTPENAENFWNTVVDPVWLANSEEADARAMRSAQGRVSIPWRVLYRVTYCERFLPPISTESIAVPQITPVMAVPVLDGAQDFLFKDVAAPGPRPVHNPGNDIEANIVLAAPTASGASAGTIAASGPNIGLPILPNNVIPFDLVKGVASIVNWGDSANAKLLTQLTTSVLGLNTVPMTQRVVPGSTKLYDVVDPVEGGPLYSVYNDPNGLTVNVPAKSGVTVYQDVNGNPIQFYDGKSFHSLQADYVATTDGTIMYYIQPPSTYDQSAFDLTGDYDLFGHPGDEWRYYLISGMSANMTSEPTVTGVGPFLSSDDFTGFTIATSAHDGAGVKQVLGYVLCQGILQWPHLNTNAETFADVLVYKAMSLLDTFPIGDPEVLKAFLKAQFSAAPFIDNEEICLVFARNIVSYFNALQQALVPQ
jgi:hypothetical protein